MLKSHLHEQGGLLDGMTFCLLGNGPSMHRVPARIGMPVMGVNRASRYRPCMLSIGLDTLTMEEESFWNTNSWVMTRYQVHRDTPPPPGPVLWTTIQLGRSNKWGWNEYGRPIQKFSAYVACQALEWMGVKKVYLAGFDLDASTHGVEGRTFTESNQAWQVEGFNAMASRTRMSLVLVSDNKDHPVRKIRRVSFKEMGW